MSVFTYYVTSVAVVRAESPQAAVDAVAAALTLDYLGEPIVDVLVDNGEQAVPVDADSWTSPVDPTEAAA